MPVHVKATPRLGSSGVAYLALDTFTDTNGSTLQNHTADTGQTWTNSVGALTIQSNEAYDPESAIRSDYYLTALPAGSTDIKVVIASMKVNDNFTGVIFRAASWTGGAG